MVAARTLGLAQIPVARNSRQLLTGFVPENQVRTRLPAGGKWIRTIGPPPEIVVDPSGSRRDHREKYGCLSARPRVRCLPSREDAAPPPKVSVRPTRG